MIRSQKYFPSICYSQQRRRWRRRCWSFLVPVIIIQIECLHSKCNDTYKETCHESALLDVVMRVLFGAINNICFDRNTPAIPESKYPHQNRKPLHVWGVYTCVFIVCMWKCNAFCIQPILHFLISWLFGGGDLTSFYYCTSHRTGETKPSGKLFPFFLFSYKWFFV